MNNSILFVSKPLTPPWNDSNKNIAFQIAKYNNGLNFYLMTKDGVKFNYSHLKEIPIYSDSGKLAPSISQNAKVLSHLLMVKKDVNILHYFFTPNPLTSYIGKFVTKLKSKDSIQTLTSFPIKTNNLKNLLFANKIITLSKDSENKLKSIGVNNSKTIYPGIEIPIELNTDNLEQVRKNFKATNDDKKVITYPGDYHYSDNKELLKKIITNMKSFSFDCKLILACRIKTELDKTVERELKSLALNLNADVCFLNNIPYIKELLFISDLVIFPINSLYAKMDIPLVLLEALYLETPILISDFAPLNEIIIENCGLKFKMNDSEDFIRKIELFFNDKSLREELINNTKLNVSENFSSQQMAEKYFKIYKEYLD